MDEFTLPPPEDKSDLIIMSDTFLQRLKYLSSSKLASKWDLQKKLYKLELSVRSIKYEKFYEQAEQVRHMLRDVLYDADNIFDECHIYYLQSQLSDEQKQKHMSLAKVRQFFSCSNDFGFRVRMSIKLNKLMKRLSEILRLRAPASYYCWPPYSPHREKGITYSHSFVRLGEIIGRESEKERVVKELLELGTEQDFSVLPNVGACGIGKTSLAKLVFNDEMIIKHFELRIWVSVSRELDLSKLTESIIKSCIENGSLGCRNYETAELQNVLKGILRGKSILLILDNVWYEDLDKWNEFKDLLMCAANGSKILVTTRNEAVASVMATLPAVFLEGLSDEICLSLFLRKAFGEGQHTDHPDLLRIAVHIVHKCEGVPLGAMVLGGSLQMETDKYYWKQVRDNNAWSSHQNEGVLPAFVVSYDRLPSHLKACLACCSLFPKDHHIEIDKLIQLWMAKGLIHNTSGTTVQELEDIGMQYFKELWSGYFFQDVEENRPIFTSVCKMHDLVHDRVLAMAKNEYMVINSHTQRIHTEVRHIAFSSYEQSQELTRSLLEHHTIRTIYFQRPANRPASVLFVENCISRFSHLWALDLSDLSFEELPSSIAELRYLRYLNLSGNSSISTLSNSICSLQILQTLRVSCCTNLIELPNDMGNMISLRHLYVTSKQDLFPDKGVARLESLRSLFISGCKNLVSISDGLQHLTNLRTLAIVDCPRLTFLPSGMKKLTALENLLIIDCEQLALFEWQDIEGLKIIRSLVIGGLAELQSSDVQCLKGLRSVVISGLPQLVELPFWLKGAADSLRYLRIAKCSKLMTLPKWLSEFRALEKLEIKECIKLTSLPDEICCLDQLKVLKINNCPQLMGICPSKDRATRSVQIPEIYIDGRLIQ